MILKILKWPDKRLNTKSVAVSSFDDDLEKLSRDMIETMDHANAIGLAANQVGDARCVAVIRIPRIGDEMVKEYHGIPIVLVNPEIVTTDGFFLSQEGCLSIPDAHDTVKRYAKISVKYQNLSGEFKTIEGGGLLASCLQHEIDHLNGQTLIDKASRLRRDMMVRRLKKTGNL